MRLVMRQDTRLSHARNRFARARRENQTLQTTGSCLGLDQRQDEWIKLCRCCEKHWTLLELPSFQKKMMKKKECLRTMKKMKKPWMILFDVYGDNDMIIWVFSQRLYRGNPLKWWRGAILFFLSILYIP